jgi:hypothetical protein
MREIIQISIQNPYPLQLIGTHHVAGQKRKNIGLLLLNFGYVPRAGHNGSAIKLCEVASRLGVEAFRVDLPGLGDSPGILPARLDQYTVFLHQGGHSQIIGKIIEEICRRYQLPQLIIGGLCAASISSLLAYQALPNKECIAGFLLLEPEFFIMPHLKTNTSIMAQPEGLGFLKKFNYWNIAVRLSGESGWLQHWPRLRAQLAVLLLTQRTLPQEINHPLLEAFRQALRDGKSMLVFTAAGKVREIYLQSIIRYCFRWRLPKNLVWHSLSHTDHIFARGRARSKIEDYLKLWLNLWPNATPDNRLFPERMKTRTIKLEPALYQ